MAKKSKYAIIKEGLLALMCVGDTIHHVRSCLSSNSWSKEAKAYHEVFTYTIAEIEEDNIVISYCNSSTRVYFDSIHVNNGMLYIWRPPLKYYTVNEDDKIEMLAEILTSKDTKFK
jgi:hypothetical protein